MFSLRFHAISNIKKKKIGVKKIIPGGGGGFRKTILSHFTYYAIFNIIYFFEKSPFTYWLNGRWFLQIVNRDSWNLYSLYPLFPCSDFVSQMWEGGVMFFSHFMLFPTFLENKIWEYKTIVSHLMFSSCFFLYARNIEKCPFTYSYWLNGGGGFSKS